MGLDDYAEMTQFSKAAIIICKFATLVRTKKLFAVDKAKYDRLIEAIKELAEYNNSADAQYYLAEYFYLIDDINNYKFWLMRAASNYKPHPLANIQLIKYCLKQAQALTAIDSVAAGKYQATAQRRLQFILDYQLIYAGRRLDWAYAKEQALLLGRQLPIEPRGPTEVWSLPKSYQVSIKSNCKRFKKMGLQAKKLSSKIKNLWKSVTY